MDAKNVFQLLGDDENAATKSLAFVLKHNKKFLSSFLHSLGIHDYDFKNIVLNVQVFYVGKEKNAITDIEIVGNDFYVIIEAKVGCNEPGKPQLLKYVRVLRRKKVKIKRLVVLTEIHCPEIIKSFGKGKNKIKVAYITWNELLEKFEGKHGVGNFKMNELFEEYVRGVLMPEQDCFVFCCDSEDNFEFSRKHKIFRYPVGLSRAPKNPKEFKYIAVYRSKYAGEKQGISEIARITDVSIVTRGDLGRKYAFLRKRGYNRNSKQKFFCIKVGEFTPIRRIKKYRGKKGGRPDYLQTSFEKLLIARYADELRT